MRLLCLPSMVTELIYMQPHRQIWSFLNPQQVQHLLIFTYLYKLKYSDLTEKYYNVSERESKDITNGQNLENIRHYVISLWN